MLRVITTPGHTPGSVSVLCETADSPTGEWLLSGDTLFRRGIGRTDLPGGDEDAIYESILTRLYPLPGDLRVYPGHGEATTIGEERRMNPFVRG
jgi:hydroxyacylglutathione hydrolase